MLADRMRPEPVPARKSYVRLVEMYESGDLKSWQRRGRALLLDRDFEFGEDGEFWGMMPFLYGNQYLAYLYICCTRHREDSGVVLAASRDGRKWHLPMGKELFIPVGPLDAWDAWGNVSLNPPVRVDDRLHIYWTARTDRPGVALSSLGADRFIGVTAGFREGFILTEPVSVAHPYLFINREGGGIRVEVRDSENRVIPGYELENCEPSEGDSVRAPVRWKDRKDLRVLVNRDCTIKFEMKDEVKLYGYLFAQ